MADKQTDAIKANQDELLQGEIKVQQERLGLAPTPMDVMTPLRANNANVLTNPEHGKVAYKLITDKAERDKAFDKARIPEDQRGDQRIFAATNTGTGTGPDGKTSAFKRTSYAIASPETQKRFEVNTVAEDIEYKNNDVQKIVGQTIVGRVSVLMNYDQQTGTKTVTTEARNFETKITVASEVKIGPASGKGMDGVAQSPDVIVERTTTSPKADGTGRDIKQESERKDATKKPDGPLSMVETGKTVASIGKLVAIPAPNVPAVPDRNLPPLPQPTDGLQPPKLDGQLKATQERKAFDDALKDVPDQLKKMIKDGKVPEELKKDTKVIKDFAEKQLKAAKDGKIPMSDTDKEKYTNAVNTATQAEAAIAAFEEQERARLAEVEREKAKTQPARSEQTSQGLDGILQIFVKLIEALTGQAVNIDGVSKPQADVSPKPVDVPKPQVVDKDREAAKAEMRQAVKDLIKLDPTPGKQGLSDQAKEAYAEKVADRYVKQNEGKMSVEDMKAKASELKQDVADIIKDGKEVAKNLSSAAKGFESGNIEAAKGDMAKAMAAAKAMSQDLAKALGKVGVEIANVDPTKLSSLAPKSTGSSGPATQVQEV